ncbi:MAG: tetratricopeptide repeat protein [candidate division NC10 bacterium]|nr:tetratricopeptide repeat protein [candidate division NC10 bacterium]
MNSGRGSGIEHLAARVRGISAVITSVVLLGFLVAVLTAMLVAAFRDTVLVEPIGAPEELVQRGYTPQVIAYRLMDEVMAIRLEYKSMKDGRAITADWTQADIQIPTTGISFKSFLSEVRRLFNIPETRIGGEITRDEDVLRLRLRLHQPGNHRHTQLVRSARGLDELLYLGAQDLIRSTDPCLLAFYLFNRDPRSAVALIEHCVANAPADDDPWAYNLWGLVHMAEGREQEGREMFLKALTLRPDFPPAYNNLGLAHTLREEYEEADAAFQKALTTNPNLGILYSTWGLSYAMRGNEKEAEEHFTKALRLEPDNPRIRLARGLSLVRMGKREQGIQEIQKAIALSPTFVAAHQIAGDYFYESRSFSDAVRHYQELARLSSHFAEQISWKYSSALVRWGEELAKQKELDAAIEKFESVLTLEPRNQRLKDRIARLKAERDAAPATDKGSGSATRPPDAKAP